MRELYFKGEREANPYHYGIIPEVTVKADGSTAVVKHYAMGAGYLGAGQAHAGRPHRLLGRRRGLRADDAVRGRPIRRSIRRHAVHRQMESDRRPGRRPRRSDLDPPGSRHRRRDRGAGRPPHLQRHFQCGGPEQRPVPGWLSTGAHRLPLRTSA
ncbi:MAG: hypothetical protein M0C28_24855 [Candidatus Moduliflexus flocculans]|nr:hypothetical protein [Candidatus Moduliflexus flocculans]